jgi:two-component system, cell cycle sensor histidine kinase and response regulator CckA
MNEEELRRSEARFRALAEASPAGIFVVEDRRLTYVNPAMAKITGYARQELIGRDPLDLVHPADRPAAEARGLFGQEPDVRHELRVRTREGDERWLDLTISPLATAVGWGLVGTGIDVTLRRQLEDGLQQRQQFGAIGRLAGGVAHDFNNLLLVIGGQVERLLDGLPAGDPLRQAAHEIERATERAATLTEHLLAFGRRQTLHARTVDVRELLDQVAASLGRDGGDPVRPIVRRPDHLPPVHADRRRLEQVLRSLYANARDALPEGGEVIMTADVVRVDEPMRAGRPWLPVGGSWVRLRIADSGPGIPASVLPRVFEPFFTTRRPGSGAGLGLSTVYGIVKQSAGYVWVDSEPGAGTCVTILLPPGAPVPRIVERERPAPAPRPRVLLVEDQDGVRELLTTVLQRNGFDVVSAASGEAAVDRASERAFDLLLTDVVLPGMTGPDVARQIRQQAPGMQVLFMSGYTGDAALDTAEFGGEASFIQKPFASKALIARLRDMLTPREDDPGLPATNSR